MPRRSELSEEKGSKIEAMRFAGKKIGKKPLIIRAALSAVTVSQPT